MNKNISGRKHRKRVMLTLKQKIDICKRLEEGISKNILIKEYNIGSSTIYDIKAQKQHLLKFLANSESNKNIDQRKTLHKPRLEQLDTVLYEWFKTMRSEGTPVTGPLLIEKAKEFYKQMKLSEHCHFSEGWLACFKQRHGIRKLVSSVESTDHGLTNGDLVEPVRSSSRNQPRLPKLQPRPAGISQDQFPEQPSSHSNLSPQHSRLSSKHSYPSHPPALSGPSTLPNQSTFDDSQLSMFLAETRMQNAELRMAMGRLTDKVDGILSKFDRFSQYQSRQRRQRLRAKQAEFEEEEDGWEENEDKESTILKSKLMTRIIAMEEKFEIMEKENISLKKDLEDTTSKLVSLQNNQPIEISDAVNSALNLVYTDLEPKFSNGVDYEGLTIRKTIAATIIAVTHQFLDSNIGEKTDSDSCRGRKMEEVPTVQIKTSKLKTSKQKLKGIPGGDLKKLSQKGYSSEIDVVASSSTTCHVDEEMNAENLDSEDRESLKHTYEKPFVLLESAAPLQEMNAENPDVGHRESLEHTHRKPFDLSESTATLQYDDELIVKEENCSDASSREGSIEMVISMEPLSPPIFDAGEMSESGEEWLPD